MSIYREMGDDDIQLLIYLYKELKWHGLANRNDIYNILLKEKKIKNLDNDAYEIAEEMGG